MPSPSLTSEVALHSFQSNPNPDFKSKIEPKEKQRWPGLFRTVRGSLWRTLSAQHSPANATGVGTNAEADARRLRKNKTRANMTNNYTVIPWTCNNNPLCIFFCLHTLLQITRYTTLASRHKLRRKMHMYKIYKRQEKESIHDGFPSLHSLRASKIRCFWNKGMVVRLTTCCGRRL